MESIISVDSLTRHFGDLQAVKGVSFDIKKGELFGFLGPNGAGKSTTISMLCTLLKPTSGSATLNNYSIVNQQNKVRASIGLVFQDPSLDDRLTAFENLQFHGIIYGMNRASVAGRAKEVLKLVELYDRRNELVKTFSGGMKRRLEIARGLMHFPKILFLDEPTLGLDPQTRNHIWSYLHKLRVEEQITVFLTTHYMDEAENCDRIAVIDHGEIIALDTPAALKDRLGGDVVRIKTTDNESAITELKERFGLDAVAEDSFLRFEVLLGETFVPRLMRDFTGHITSITVHEPTLDDVFLSLTGRAIRSESTDGVDRMKAQARMYGARRPH
ncbi:MAG: ATP-binding cassette domain-containing protein [Actinobacteria bacterium]|nr:ATP-binding cassette domain-containing protein [Actinomycetota bacterium]